MTKDIRYSELVFLQSLPAPGGNFNHQDPKILEATGLNQMMFVEMILMMLEELYVRMDDPTAELLVGKLRGEVGGVPPGNVPMSDWNNPRNVLERLFAGNKLNYLRVTYRGLRRIAELRELLARDRIMEPFGVLAQHAIFSKGPSGRAEARCRIPTCPWDAQPLISAVYPWAGRNRPGTVDSFGSGPPRAWGVSVDAPSNQKLPYRRCCGAFATESRPIGR